MDVILWVILAAVLAVAEIFTATLFLIMFSVGATAAAAAAALGAPVPLQAGVFVVVSALTLAAARPALRRHLNRPGRVGMGTELMQGTSAVVVEHVNADSGMVKIGGELWQARSLENLGDYPPGDRVTIVDIGLGTVVVWREDLPGSTDREL
ncbi:NfeD family protein [Jidongwangia harbinensis]|uniref:NfeD family protein n=1 Tax=Jidongwangia harbinensis TaxID=2878561 RepID=UPI001CD974D3|nr:NfeD family protein [Jidongwangia harbinensis]MCA2219055.1 NfeD family protein [Jidongwangia harbinensis]